MNRICVIICLIFQFCWMSPLTGEDTIHVGIAILPKSEDVPVRLNNRIIATGKDLEFWVEVREVQGDSIRVWVQRLHMSGWVNRSDVCTTKEAIKYFTEQIDANPNNGTNYFYRSAANCEYGRYEQAIDDATESIRLLPSARALTMRAKVWNRAKVFSRMDEVNGYDYAHALKDYDEAIRLAPNSSAAYVWRGRTKQAAGDLKGAVSDLTEAIRLDPKDPLSYGIRGSILSTDIAIDVDFEKAIADFTAAIKLDPSNEICARDAYSSRGEMWAAKGEHAKAVSDFTEAIRLEPSNPFICQLYDERGHQWLELADYEKAIADYTEAVRVCIDESYRSMSLCYRGIALARQGQSEKAIADFSEAIAMHRDNAEAYLLRAQVRDSTKEYDKALDDFSTAILIEAKTRVRHGSNPARTIMALSGRGDVLAKLGRRDETIADYTEVIRLDPTNVRAFYNRAATWYNKREYGKAIEDFTHAIKLDPTDADAFAWRGLARVEQNDFGTAIDDYNQSLRLNPDSALICNRVAWLLATCPTAKFRDGPKAIELATMAKKLSETDNAAIEDTLAAAYAEAGRFEDAIKTQLRAIELAPESMKAEFRSKLELYQAEKPYHEQLKAHKKQP